MLKEADLSPEALEENKRRNLQALQDALQVIIPAREGWLHSRHRCTMVDGWLDGWLPSRPQSGW